jgi:hypothetical protein
MGRVTRIKDRVGTRFTAFCGLLLMLGGMAGCEEIHRVRVGADVNGRVWVTITRKNGRTEKLMAEPTTQPSLSLSHQRHDDTIPPEKHP